MHLEILSNEQVDLLPLISQFKREYYLVGGTAIALHIGHRESIDFDLFKLASLRKNDIYRKVTISKFGYKIIHWNLITGDPDPGISAKRMAKVMIEQAKPGAILIGHANGRGKHTAEALKVIVKALREKGFEFVTVSELLKAGSSHFENSCEAKIFSAYQEKPLEAESH